MSVYVVAQLRIENRDLLDKYVEKVIPSLKVGGGKIIAFDETPEVIEGTADYPRTVIIQFENAEAFRMWYDSADYQSILQMRLDSAPGNLTLVRGLPRD